MQFSLSADCLQVLLDCVTLHWCSPFCVSNKPNEGTLPRHSFRKSLQARRHNVPDDAGPGAVGLKTVRMVANRLVASSVFSSHFCAHVLLGNKDTTATFQTVPFTTWLFVEGVRAGAGGVRGGDAAYTPAPWADGRVGWASQADDYRHRPLELRALSPYTYFMWFAVVKNKQQAAPATCEADGDAYTAGASDGEAPHIPDNRFRLAAQHPFAATHAVRRRRKPVVPQPLSDPPARPAEDDVTEKHEIYAATMLGLLFADWDWQERLRQADGSPWRALLAWEAEHDDADPDDHNRAIARYLQRNFTAIAAARRRIRHSARTFGAQPPVEEEAGADEDDSDVWDRCARSNTTHTQTHWGRFYGSGLAAILCNTYTAH